MNKILYFLVISIGITSCDSTLNSNPHPSKFEYYQKEFKLAANSKLRTDGFYASPNTTEDEGVYEYLKFYPDGFVVHFGGTSMTPKAVSKGKYLNVERKKNGAPKDNKENWGYFKCKGDSLKFTFVKHRGLSSPMYKYLGKIKGDTLLFETYQLPLHEDMEMSKGNDCRYVFYAR